MRKFYPWTERSVFLVRFADRGQLTFSWNDVDVNLADHDVLFSLHFNVLSDNRLSDIIAINSELSRNEAYSSDLDYNQVVMEWTGDLTNTSSLITSNKAFPNPFKKWHTASFKCSF